jgi:hypothetical protein
VLVARQTSVGEVLLDIIGKLRLRLGAGIFWHDVLPSIDATEYPESAGRLSSVAKAGEVENRVQLDRVRRDAGLTVVAVEEGDSDHARERASRSSALRGTRT